MLSITTDNKKGANHLRIHGKPRKKPDTKTSGYTYSATIVFVLVHPLNKLHELRLLPDFNRISFLGFFLECE